MTVYPPNKTYRNTSGDLSMTATVYPPDQSHAEFQVTLQWSNSNSNSLFLKPTYFSISRSKNCVPVDYTHLEGRQVPVLQFEANLDPLSQQYSSEAYSDSQGLENDTCYTYKLTAARQTKNDRGEDVTDTEDVSLAVPIGNAGFER
ncbi:MAG: hypothetical protein HY537_00485 [Deltaproteobacteria bacterium]|nr:hypothetical protein [Deltaproteobacteria bacterium]